MFTFRWTEFSDATRSEIIAKYEQVIEGDNFAHALKRWAEFWNPVDYVYDIDEIESPRGT